MNATFRVSACPLWLKQSIECIAITISTRTFLQPCVLSLFIFVFDLGNALVLRRLNLGKSFQGGRLDETSHELHIGASAFCR